MSQNFICSPMYPNRFAPVFNYRQPALEERLIDLQCKHVVSDIKRNELTKLAKKVGYKWSVLGSHRNTTINDEIKRIKAMECGEVLRPIRIVVDKSGRFWADNTHWTIAYVLRYGINTKVCDVPCYVVDLEKKTIWSYRDSIYPITNDNLVNITENSLEIQHRLDNGWRPLNISYTIEALINDLNLINVFG